MAAPIGNRFWMARTTHGRDLLFSSPDILLAACVEYFTWVEENPLYETRAFSSKDGILTAEIPKMRAMSVSGLCIFLDIVPQTWADYRKREGFSEVCTRVDEMIRTQKFQGAAAELLNPAIIARDLGLADRSELSGVNGEPIKSETKITRIELVPAPFPDREGTA
ncbi:terminase small subunit [Bradyrhizobium sp. HKCCYLRH2015]|uniref:terminase small subunit n=1 Tax=Bradyrhizobium sp. HKCCYLRH2015 TaxID=3420742 RepID=UPI003EBCADE1